MTRKRGKDLQRQFHESRKIMMEQVVEEKKKYKRRKKHKNDQREEEGFDSYGVD